MTWLREYGWQPGTSCCAPLTLLQARRQRRAPLPPRHPRAAVAAPVRAPQPSEPAPAAEQGRGGSSLAEAVEPTPRSGRSAPQRQVPKAKVTEQVELRLRLAQFYVTPQHDEALGRIRATGLVTSQAVPSFATPWTSCWPSTSRKTWSSCSAARRARRRASGGDLAGSSLTHSRMHSFMNV